MLYITIQVSANPLPVRIGDPNSRLAGRNNFQKSRSSPPFYTRSLPLWLDSDLSYGRNTVTHGMEVPTEPKFVRPITML